MFYFLYGGRSHEQIDSESNESDNGKSLIRGEIGQVLFNKPIHLLNYKLRGYRL